MAEAPPRDRAALARSAIIMKMDGPKKTAKFGLLRKGKYTGVTVVLNTHTKFSKLTVGKHVVTAKQRNSGYQLFPLTVALNGLDPLSKVWVDYLPHPKNIFTFKVNDLDIYAYVKEEVDYDPSKTEPLTVLLEVNDKPTIRGAIPWIVEEVEEKIQTALGMNHLSSLRIEQLEAKSWVVNEFLDLLACSDLPEQGLEQLILKDFKP